MIASSLFSATIDFALLVAPGVRYPHFSCDVASLLHRREYCVELVSSSSRRSTPKRVAFGAAPIVNA